MPPATHKPRFSRTAICLAVCALAVPLSIPAAHAAESDNTVDITIGYTGDVMGGGSIGYTGDAARNTVNMIGGTVSENIYGGYSESGNVTHNIVSMTGGGVSEYVYGGWSVSGDATNNTVNMVSGTLGQSIYGGYVDGGSGNATNNTVTMTGGTVRQSVAGGYSKEGNATNNTTTMTGGTVGYHLFGGYSDEGETIGNTVTLVDGTVNMEVIGGWTNSGTGNATGNIVTMLGGTVGGGLYGGNSDEGNAINNTVTMKGGAVTESVYGGFVYFGAGNATLNTVNMAGGTVNENIYGGVITVGTGNTTHNTVNMTTGTVNQYIYGGWSDSGDSINNTVNMTSGTVNGGIYGGYSDSGNATHNTVNLHGGTIAGGVYGGGALTGTGDVRTGNALNVRGFQGSLKEVNNFSHYSFLLPASIQSGDTLIHITGGTPTDLAGTTADLSMAGSSSALVPGSTVVLIDKVANKSDTTDVTATQGIALIYDFALSVDGSNRFIATLKNTQTNPQTQALSEGRIASLAMLNQGSDLFITSGIRNARAVTEKGERFIAFGAVSGESLRYNSGSHVDVDSFSILAGGAMRNNNLLLGAFFEAGWGDYNSYNSFASAASVKGKGDTSYYGAGIFARYDWGAPDADGLYADASLRAGRVKTDFSSHDLVSATGEVASYDISSPYYGLHAGLGYELNISDTLMLDVTTRYLWTHQNGKTVHVLGDPFEFKAMNSHRWRTGARLSYTTPGSNFAPYAGAYYEHEFGGTAKASVHGLDVGTPDLKGSTGIAELGFTFRPAHVKGLSVNVGVQGYAGKREGVSGNIDIKLSF